MAGDDSGRATSQSEDVPCPERDCELELLSREEVRAHLEWDHNRSTSEAEAMLDAE